MSESVEVHVRVSIKDGLDHQDCEVLMWPADATAEDKVAAVAHLAKEITYFLLGEVPREQG